MSNWQDYNSKLIKKSIDLIQENKLSIFNSEENRCYSHIRDLVALTIAHNSSKYLNILDYGSNIMPWSNIQNKIDLRNISVTIYDPFSKIDYSKNINFGFPISVINDNNKLKDYDFDILIFGSSSQYIKNFYKQLINDEIKLAKKILFLDTPFSLKEDLNLSQTDQLGRKYPVFIRKFDKLISIMNNKKYSLKFKSCLPWETQEFLDIKLSSKIKIINLLFEKID